MGLSRIVPRVVPTTSSGSDRTSVPQASRKTTRVRPLLERMARGQLPRARSAIWQGISGGVPGGSVRTRVNEPTILLISHVVPYPPAAGNESRILRMLAWLRRQRFRLVLLLNHDPLPSD